MADQKRLPIVHSGAFTMVGIEARTSNAREMTSDGVIGKLWERLLKGDLLAKIPDRADNKIVALYTDYESDKDGLYSYLLGARAKEISAPPEGMKARSVPASGPYALFTAQGGLPQDAVVALWKQVWTLEAEHRVVRAYQSDYEVHHVDQRGEVEIELYIGVKS